VNFRILGDSKTSVESVDIQLFKIFFAVTTKTQRWIFSVNSHHCKPYL